MNFQFNQLFRKLSGTGRAGMSFGKNPSRDWRIVFSVFIVVLICLSVFSAYLFYATYRGDIFKIAQIDTVVLESLSRDSLDKVVSLFETKKDKLRTLERVAPAIADPSL